MGRPFISIVIPAYNEEAVIADCLDSVYNQTLPNREYEVVVVNNCSTDKTEQIARSSGVRIINEPKKGYVCALRTGCAAALGEIIAVTDADTIVPKDWAEKICHSFRQDPQIIAVGGGTILKPGFLFAKLAETFLNITSPLLGYFVGYNFSVRRDIYEKSGGFRADMNLNADTEFSLRLRKYGKTVFLKNNAVITSSRHYKGMTGILYCFKSVTNFLALVLFNRTVFLNFKDIRE